MESENENNSKIFALLSSQAVTTNWEATKDLRLKRRLVFEELTDTSKQSKFVKPIYILDRFASRLAVESGWIALEEDKKKRFLENALKNSQVDYTVYKDLYNRGYFVMDGTKFGADFVIYEKDPSLDHAKSLVFVQGPTEWNIIEINRVSTVSKKDCLIASVYEDKDSAASVQYLKISKI